MKQEKKPTVWLDIEANLEPWQEQTYGRLSRGLKKGKMFYVSSGRRTGKSMLSLMYMAGSTYFADGTSFSGPAWGKWEETFVWPWSRKESITKKKIWGKVMMREHNVAYAFDGNRQRQYATKKEVFERNLKGLD